MANQNYHDEVASQMFEDLNELFQKDYLNEIFQQKPEDQTLEDYINELFKAKPAEPAFQTAVQNILEEPVAENTKRRLLAPLLPRAYVPRPPPRRPRIRNTKTPRGMERFDPFYSMHFEREITALERKWLERSWEENLANPRGENPIQEQHFQFLIEEYAPEGVVEKQRQNNYQMAFLYKS